MLVIYRMASVISKMGFVFSEQGFSKIMVPVCISISICCSATGFVYQVISLYAFSYSNLGVSTQCSLTVCRLFIILGVILLVSSTRLMALLPRPMRRHLKSNLEKNQTLRRSGSVRAKDPSPSAVIQASTLHHLVTSPAKEKA
ncbi:hypothetical protein BHE74_00007010 [Ensete ventricosum]|nr:hypothetical protein BHE74_00007010 [Ensete ventricosum]RZR85649.1 hypothetical protein BHM03_00012667 [Ensete ventricosum]